MARIIAAPWMIRYPLGGVLSWNLQWLVGFQRLGHEVFLLERSGYPNACFDPAAGVMGDDCASGARAVNELLSRFGLDRQWCFLDEAGACFGLSRAALTDVLRTADLFVDLGTHGAWLPDLAAAGSRARTVLVDGEPGYTQMKRELKRAAGAAVPEYDFYYSNGANVGTPDYLGPTAGRAWRAVFNPVVPDLFPDEPPPSGAPFTTVMNWQAHAPFTFGGREFGQKDVEFARFIDLPGRVSVPMEVAVSGRYPKAELEGAGWDIRSAHGVTESYDGYLRYIRGSAGEFSVCKEGYVALRTGWFSDRSAAYLAAGRPVVLQDTGFGAHLPCGRGLFGVATVDEAAAAIEAVAADPRRHAAAAREVAAEYLDARVVLERLLDEVGV
jgi:hypothetical protein